MQVFRISILVVLFMGSAPLFAQNLKEKGKLDFHGFINKTPWFSDSMVSREFNLSKDQLGRLNAAYSEAYNRFYLGMDGIEKLGQEQQMQRLQDLTLRFQSGFGEKVSELLSPAQYERFQQLHLQYRHLDALEDRATQEKLNLTDTQRRALHGLQMEYNQELREILKEQMKNYDSAAKHFSNLRQKSNDEIANILTQEQLKTWRQLTGAI